jgi:hypothetical protein
MSVYVFTGPTIAAAHAAKILDAQYCPPATQGSIFQAACRKPRAIALIDGRFESAPSVWHKEILWAMREGIHVFGSSSMGALRAAELEPFGMIGVGEIFSDYLSGVLEDDDEVAVSHAPAEKGFAPTSEALVNIRATLAAAQRQGVIHEASERWLAKTAKEMFYAERSWDLLLARSHGMIAEAEREALNHWLRAGRVDQKREDALLLLAHIKAFLDSDPPANEVPFHFQNTSYWEKVLSGKDENRAQRENQAGPGEAIFEELQMAASFENFVNGALLRFLSTRESVQSGFEPDSTHVAVEAREFRRNKRLEKDEEFLTWLVANRLSANEFTRLMQDQARLRWATSVGENGIRMHMLNQLRTSGEYEGLAGRAERKRKLLEERGLLNPAFDLAGVSEEELFSWYFAQSGQKLPDGDDLYAFAHGRGFESLHHFKRALLREYCFVKLTST